MIQSAKNSEDYKAALSVAQQYGARNAYEDASMAVTQAFNADDIRRMKRFLREWQEQEAEDVAEKVG